MKPLRLLFLFLIYTTVCAHAQWEMQLDIQNFSFLDRIFFLDENHGWAIGGPYFYTSNGGENWYLYDDWWNIMGTDIVFVNQDTGFIAGGGGIILKTINGGQTWTEIQTPATQDARYLFFVDENNGWATLGSYSEGKILHTENNGDNWVLQSFIESNTSANVYSIYFMNENNGWGGGDYYENGTDYSVLKYTTDKGETWLTKYTSTNPMLWFIDIYFVDSLNGWVVGQKCSLNKYLILHTEDGGETWEEQSLQGIVDPSILNCLYFVNETTGWIGAGEALYTNPYGAIYFTNNGGQDWQLQQEFYKPIYDIHMLNCDTGWAVGADYIYHTTNGDTTIINRIDDNIQKDDLIKVIPNPFHNTIQLQISKEYQFSEIVITDVVGKVCLQYEEFAGNPIDLDFLQKGMYFLTIQYQLNHKIYLKTKKIIKL